jgi:hypothetical protein
MDGSEYKTLYKFLQSKEYPDNSTLNEKRALRKRAEHFILKDQKIYYKIKEGE